MDNKNLLIVLKLFVVFYYALIVYYLVVCLVVCWLVIEIEKGVKRSLVEGKKIVFLYFKFGFIWGILILVK